VGDLPDMSNALAEKRRALAARLFV